ncbi:MAG: DeoR/GlpR family DNA-binding transcription regulator [Actinomycetota bacterium]
MTDRAADTPTPALFQSERQRAIVALTLRAGRVEVAELSERFGVTTETIRRDLSELQERRVVRRVHGGAVPWETSGFEPLLAVRAELQTTEKQRIARRAIEELPDTGSIIIDSGSTTGRFAEAIPLDSNLRIVTNSLATAQVLSKHDGIDVIVIGGKVRKNTLAMVDATAVAAVEPLTVDALFISCDGLSSSSGLSTPYREEAALKHAMIRAARRVVALVDHSKVGQEHFIRFADWSDIDVLVTNTEVDPTVVATIEAAGTTVLLA